jgi:peptidoglycan hydrolase-like protein with peptidoglycan-binding domain
VLAAAVGFWASRVAMLPPADPLDTTPEQVTYEVVTQTLSRSLSFTAVARWDRAPIAHLQRGGVVTSVDIAPGAEISAGDILYTVDLRPTVAAVGAVPSFRDIGPGATGPDVAQLQSMLHTLGYLDADAGDTFGPDTEAATRAWQSALGLEADGVVRLGDVAFVPVLPVRVVPTDALAVGATVGPGGVAIEALAATPDITIPLGAEQRDLVPLSGPVVIAYPGGTWEGVIARAAEPTGDDAGSLELVVEAADGGPICGDECLEQIPPLVPADFEAQIAVVPETTGPVVPVAAISTGPGGEHTVTRADRTSVRVQIVTSTGGLAVVSGIDAGETLLMPFADPGAS